MPWLALICMIGIGFALPNQGAAATLTVAYVELQGDSRYDQGRMDARIPGQPWGRPFAGAALGTKELRFPLATLDVRLKLRRTRLREADELEATLRMLVEEDIGLVFLDLSAPLVKRAAQAAESTGQILFNVTADGDALRGEACHYRLFHLLPSVTMRMDAMAQYLVERRWDDVLLLSGQRDQDRRLAEAFRTAAKRYGLTITRERRYVPGTDPRQREANNPDLLTRGDDFDVIFVADGDAEFAQRLPYRTRAPRPVVGSGGLIATWWHWNWQRHGAPQLNSRFEQMTGRRMTAYDWSAWIGVKAIGEAVLRTKSTAPTALARYLRSSDLVLDGFQGYRLSFRAWNGQLRSAIFLASPNWVAARAPLEGFLHPRNDLDSLGRDAAESECRLQGEQP